jgi:hypothetical protein
MVKDNYLTEGTLTDFTGIPFGKDEPMTYLEGKRVLKLLMRKIRANKKAIELGLDVKKDGRGGITQDEYLWDFISFKTNDQANNFTNHMHFDVALAPKELCAFLIVPNSVKGIRKNIKSLNFEDFLNAARKVAEEFDKVSEFKHGCVPMIEIVQRRYLSQRSVPVVDGSMKFDIRTSVESSGNVKFQQEWLKASLEMLQNKKANIQMGIGVCFRYDDCKELKKSTTDDLVLKAWEMVLPIKEIFRTS